MTSCDLCASAKPWDMQLTTVTNCFDEFYKQVVQCLGMVVTKLSETGTWKHILPCCRHFRAMTNFIIVIVVSSGIIIISCTLVLELSDCPLVGCLCDMHYLLWLFTPCKAFFSILAKYVLLRLALCIRGVQFVYRNVKLYVHLFRQTVQTHVHLFSILTWHS